MRAVNRHLESLYGARLGAHVLKPGEQQVLSFHLELLGDRFLPKGQEVLSLGIQLLADMLLDPRRDPGATDTLSPDALAQERDKQLRYIASLVDDKASYAYQRCTEIMCDQEPYRLFEYGSQLGVEAITPASLEARRTHLLATAPFDVYAVGALDPARAHDLIARALEPLAQLRQDPLPPLRGTTPHPDARPPRAVTDTFDVHQAKLCLGLRHDARLTDPGYWAALVMNGILGGFPHSKLFRNVRERAGLCYDASSSLERFKGLLFIAAGVEPADTERARDLCLAQLDAIARGEIDHDELEFTRRAFHDSLRILLDSPPRLAGHDYVMSLGGRSGRPQDALDALAAITRDDVTAAAQHVRLDTSYTIEPHPGDA